MAINYQDVLSAIAEDMTKANEVLLESAPDRFMRNVLNYIQREIESGKKAAIQNRYHSPDSRVYVYYNPFPMAMYEGLTSDFRQELEKLDVYLYVKEGIQTAMIRITYHF